MSTTEKTANREHKSRSFRDFVASLADIASVIQKPSSSNILDALNRARFNEQNAASSQLTQARLSSENPEIDLPDELTDEAIARYFSGAADLYAGVATDYAVMADYLRAYRYFRKAWRNCGDAIGLSREDKGDLLKKMRDYRTKADAIRQEIARKGLRARRFGFGFLARRKRQRRTS